MKKRGFGRGWWNGFGGKVKSKENLRACVEREVSEEIGVKINNSDKVGFLKFSFEHKPEIIKVHVFKTTSFTGSPSETQEMGPRWFNLNRIPYNKMWPDDKFWMPLFLSNKKFTGEFRFGKNYQIISHKLKTLK